MSKAKFFTSVRKSVFGGSLTSSQVAGLERIIGEADKRQINTEYLAYVLATAAWEGAYTMQPITERGARSYFNKYEPGTKIGKILGNKHVGDGYKYRGRGDVMITGLDNYDKASKKLGVDLVRNPELALDPKISVRILFDGMLEGWFTGKALKDYLDGIDEDDKEDLREFANGRRIINGTDKQMAIAEIALKFEKALRDAGRPETGWLTVVEVPKPVASTPTVVDKVVAGPAIAFSLISVLAALWYWFIDLPCSVVGIFCGA